MRNPIASFRFAAAKPGLVDAGGHPASTLWTIEKDLFWSDAEGVLKHDEDRQRRAVVTYDLYDSWEFPSAQFDSLMLKIDELLRARGSQQALLLSGDVHSSFASRLTVFARSTPAAPRMVIAQMIASPLKNQTKKTRGQQLEGYEYAPNSTARHLVPKFVPEAFDGPTFGGVGSRYRLDYLTAVPAGSPPDPLVIQQGDDVANLRNYSKVSEKDNTLTYSGATPLQIIGHNSIAELTFRWGSDKRARQTVHWVGPGDKTFDTVYDVSLNLNDPAYPLL